MGFDLSIITRFWPIFLRGFGYTLYVSVLATGIGLCLGLLVALGRISHLRLLRWVTGGYVEVMRGTPLLIQVFIVYYALPDLGIRFSAITSGVIAMSLYMGAYVAEILRAGILSIHRGQVEAARSLGMSYAQTLRRIVLPLMVSLVLPPLTNEFTTLIKWSAVLSVVTVPELTYSAQDVIGITFSPVEGFVVVTLLYWGLNDLFVHVARVFEKRAARYT
jgi:His/Glu/Gln/Arg/opine family amino acid ABC transporter permease subunit